MADQDKQTREQRIQGDTSLAKTAAQDFGGSPQQPIVDAPAELAGVTARLTNFPVLSGPGTLTGQILVRNTSPVDLVITAANLWISPPQAGGTVSHPFLSGPMSAAIRLDGNDLAVLGPVAVTVHAPGFYKIGATVRLRVKGAEAGTPLEHIEAEPFPIGITPR